MEETQQQSFRLKDKKRLTFYKIFGSILVILSGFLPFIDNIIVWINPNFAFTKNAIGGYVRNDYWLLSLYYTTAFVIIGKFMKAYPLTFYFPLFASLYCSTIYVIMFVIGIKFEPEWPHRIGLIIMLIPGAYILFRFINYIKDLILQDKIQFNTIERLAKLNNNIYGENN